MKKIMRSAGVALLVGCLLMSNVAYADAGAQHIGEVHSDETFVEGQKIVWEKEVVVELSSEEEFWLYPKNPNYRYTFIILNPSQARSICYMCGSPYMGTMTQKDQADGYPSGCPNLIGFAGDVFSRYDHTTYERCTACGYKSDPWVSFSEYTAICGTGDNPPNRYEWEVRYEFTQTAGYNIHQSLRWWTEGSYI